MKYLISLFTVFLFGCSTTVPVVAKFPTMPETLMAKCAPLEKLGEDVKLSDVAKSVALNYTLYHECSIKHDAIIEWYNTQKKIFEDIK